jgi:hypothetical protein
MKIKNIVSHLLIIFMLASCAPVFKIAITETLIPSPSFTLTSSTTTFTPTPRLTISPPPAESTAGFIRPDPETYVRVLPAVLEYFYYRKQAMISGSVETLWEKYPELKNDIDFSKGINSEGFFISNYHDLKLFDGNIFPEAYEPIKVKVRSDEIEVLVHGMELYLFLDENKEFTESGGEIKIVLYLHMKNGHWIVFKTDEVLQSEWQQFSP